jgi:hypothetical protein
LIWLQVYWFFLLPTQIHGRNTLASVVSSFLQFWNFYLFPLCVISLLIFLYWSYIIFISFFPLIRFGTVALKSKNSTNIYAFLADNICGLVTRGWMRASHSFQFPQKITGPWDPQTWKAFQDLIIRCLTRWKFKQGFILL